jgi:hypothetical protein
MSSCSTTPCGWPAAPQADGVDVTLEVRGGLPHNYHINADRLDDADEALDRAAVFLGARLPIASAMVAGQTFAELCGSRWSAASPVRPGPWRPASTPC